MNRKLLYKYFLSLSLFWLVNQLAYSQCLLNCKNHINVSLNTTCTRTLTPVSLGYNFICPSAVVQLVYPDERYQHLAPDQVDGSLRGQTIKYRIVDTATSNSCWGYITIEDKLPPILDCDTVTIHCFDPLPVVEDLVDENCEFRPKISVKHDRWVPFDCSENDSLIGYYERRLVISDVWKNSRECTQIIQVLKATIDSMVCPASVEIPCCEKRFEPGNPKPVDVLWSPYYSDIDANGYAHPKPIVVNGQSIGLVDPPFLVDNGDTTWLWPQSAKCQYVIEYSDWLISTCGSTYKIRREWLIKDWCEDRDTVCIQWIKVSDNDGPVLFFGHGFTPVITGYTEPHKCHAGVTLTPPTIYNDCTLKSEKNDRNKALKKFEASYVIEYIDETTHPAKAVVLNGKVPYGSSTHVYLPKSGLLFVKPNIQVKWTVMDDCWNASTICQTVLILDRTPPTPVCDEHTQVTLDPQTCRAVLKAKDLDDGSRDNCDSVHYAVARMSDIEYWRKYWKSTFDTCGYNHYEFIKKEKTIDKLIEEWIDFYVFDDEVSVTNCGEETLVLRVYESFDLPPYDPHRFKGSRHAWYSWFRSPFLRYSSYRCNYVYYYDSLDIYHDKFYPDITCDDVELAYTLDVIKDLLRRVLVALNTFDFESLGLTPGDIFSPMSKFQTIEDFIAYLLSQNCESIVPDELACFDLNEVINDLDMMDMGDLASQPALSQGYTIFDPRSGKAPEVNKKLMLIAPSQESKNSQTSESHSFIHALLGQYYVLCFGADTAKKNKVIRNLNTYPELRAFATDEVNILSLLYSGMLWKRFLDLPYYSDCMIQVLKDDKTPPKIKAPADFSIFSDGVPYYAPIELKTEDGKPYIVVGARDAWVVCNQDGDYLTTGSCPSNGWYDVVGGRCCVKVPWNSVHGFYGGPTSKHYQHHTYNDPCDYQVWRGDDQWDDQNYWRPIYCAIWLYLDKFDDPDFQKRSFEFGLPAIYDNCTDTAGLTVTTKDGDHLNECNYGYLTREWTVSDSCGNSSSAHQSIQVLPRSDFEVIFPADTLINCESLVDLDPKLSGLGPIISDNEIELIGINYEDKPFEIVDGACYKILRTWTIIDWCTFSPEAHFRHPDVIVDDRKVAGGDRDCIYRHLKDDGDGFIKYLQVIKVKDFIAPEIECIPNLEVCTYDEDCKNPLVKVELGSATDNCTRADLLKYRHVLKTLSGTTVLRANGLELNANLAYGEYEVSLIVSDGCGNEDTCQTTLTVKDCKKPTPYCHHGISTVVMPSTGCVTIWAKDLESKSEDNCTPHDNLIFSFSEDVSEQSLTICCEDILNNGSRVFDLKVWVTDEDGNQEFCVTYLSVQPGSQGACKDISLTDQHQMELLNQTAQHNNPGQKSIRSSTQITFRENQGWSQDQAVLFQNQPNPFYQETTIRFFLPQSQFATLEFIDLAGKTLHRIAADYDRGYHEQMIKENILKTSGIIYYRLTTANAVLTRKMIVVN